MVSQGFFSGSESAEKRSRRLAGQKENKVALGGDNLGSVGAITAVGAIGSLGIKGIRSAIEGGKRLKENIEKRVNPERDTSFFSPSGNEVAKVASSDLSNLRVGSPEVRIANVKSYTDSTYKPTVPDEVGDYIKQYDKPKYKEEEKTYTPPKKESYFDQTVKESPQGIPHMLGESFDKGVDVFTRHQPGTFQERKDEYVRKNLKYGTAPDGTPTATSTSVLNYGQPLTVSTEKLKSFMVKDAKENQYQSLVNRAERAEIAEHNKKIDAINQLETKKIVDRFGYDPRGLIDPNAPVGTRIDEKTGLQVYPKRPSIFSNDDGFDYSTLDQKTINKIKQDHNLNFDVEKGFFRKEEKQDYNTVPAGAFSITPKPKDEPKLNRLEEAKKQPKLEDTKNIFQRIGDTVGNVFNKVTGTEAVADGTLQAQGINTSATRNLRQMGYVSDDLQKARDALAKANLRRSGLDKTVGGQSSQANYGSGRTGGFGTGTHGRGMPSNPAGMRQKGVGVSAGNLSRHKAGPSTSRGGISRSTSRGQGGGPSSRSRGGTGTGRSSQGSKSSARGARGSAGSRSRGGTGTGRTSTSRSASKASRSRTGRSKTRCDIRTKIDISPLINSNLVKDNLAEVAYFVEEIKR